MIERGDTISRYIVLGRAGAGAMGVVYAAYDPELDRKVALKLLDVPESEGGLARVRLQREAQALAKLDHRNVVTVHDVGVHAGQLFIAMEFVEGQTLRTWMSQDPRPWAEVVAVFVEAGRGLAAAHAVGLVHRDFKPANVMLGGEGRVRVMDFGLARATGVAGEDPVTIEDGDQESSSRPMTETLTQTGALLGTPAYMSPEQHDGAPADAASDQFGFCVALYEALYAERPFVGETLAQLRYAVIHGRVREAPSAAAVPAWLRKIVVRGLAADPSQRWASMQDLLDALTDDPRVRRRRWLVGGALALAVTGGAWGLASSSQAVAPVCEGMDAKLAGIWDDERRADVKAALLATELDYAVSTAPRVEAGLDDYTARWVEARREACEATQRGEQSGELLDRRMACLDRHLVSVRATVDELASADARTLSHAVELVSSLPTLDRCADVDALIAEVAPPEDPAVAERVAALDDQLVEVGVKARAGKLDEATALVDAILVEAEALDYEPLLVRARLRAGNLYDDRGQLEEAERTFGLALDSGIALRMRREPARAASLLVYLATRQGHYEDADRWLRLSDSLARAEGSAYTWSDHLLHGAGLQVRRGDFDGARGSLEEALAVMTESADPDYVLAMVENNLGHLELQVGGYDAAQAHFERGRRLWSESLSEGHPNIALIDNNLGILAMTRGRYAEALAHWQAAVAIWEAVDPELPEIMFAYSNMSAVAEVEGRYEDMRRYAVQAIALGEAKLGPDHVELANPLTNLGVASRLLDDREQARVHLQRAQAIRERQLGPDHPDLAYVPLALGDLACDVGDYAEARRSYERAHAQWLAGLGPDHLNLGYALDGLGRAANGEGDYASARIHFDAALELRERSVGADHPDMALSLTGLAQAQLGLGEVDAARANLERALAIQDTHHAPAEAFARTHFALARALWLAPSDSDRARARELAEDARATLASYGQRTARELAEVDAWLAEHEDGG